MTCLASVSGDQSHAKLLDKDDLKTSSKTKPRKERKFTSEKKTEKKQLECDYCDKIFDVREIDTIHSIIAERSKPFIIAQFWNCWT